MEIKGTILLFSSLLHTFPFAGVPAFSHPEPCQMKPTKSLCYDDVFHVDLGSLISLCYILPMEGV